MFEELSKLVQAISDSLNTEHERQTVILVFLALIGIILAVCCVGICFGIMKCCIECAKKPKAVVVLNDRIPAAIVQSPIRYQRIDDQKV